MKSWEASANGIKGAINGLNVDLQQKREQHREAFHQSLIVALHTDSLWKKAKWS
jgi:hypothetical protein